MASPGHDDASVGGGLAHLGREIKALRAELAGQNAELAGQNAALLGALEAQSAALRLHGASLASQQSTLASLVRDSQERAYVFSAASPPAVGRAIQALDIELYGSLAVPELAAAACAACEFEAFPWGAATELQSSAALRERLEEWVAGGERPPPHALIDVQHLAAHNSLRLSVPGVGSFSGMPDAIYCRKALRDAELVVPVSMSAVVSVDWKRPSAMAEVASIVSIGRIQAIAFAEAGRAVPVFLTDLAASGFRGWIVISGCLYELHPPDRALTLAEGVALIRLFLARAEAGHVSRVVDNALVGVARARRDGAVRGGGGGGGGASAPAGGGPTRRAALQRGSVLGGAGGAACGSASGDDGGDGGSGDSGCDGDSPDTVFSRVAGAMAEGCGLQLCFFDAEGGEGAAEPAS